MSEFNLPPGVTSSRIPGNRPEDEECQHGYLLGLDCPECGKLVATDENCPPGMAYIFQEPLKHGGKKPKVQLDRKGRILPRHKRKRAKLTPEKAAKREENLAKARLNQPIKVTLTMPHWRNGVNYGPGILSLPRSLAMELLSEEQARTRADARFFGSRSVIIGPRGRTGSVRVVEVPAETFELPYDKPNLYADRIDGTKHGSDTGEGGKF